MSEKAPSAPHEQPSSYSVLKDFENHRDALTSQVDSLNNQPGFKMNGEQIIRRRHEQKLAAEALAAFASEYSQLGGDAIDEAQKAVDSLNFRSSAEDHIKAKTALRDSRDKFYENYINSQNADATESPVDKTDDEKKLDERNTNNEHPADVPAFSVGQEVTVVRNVYKDGKIVDKDGKIETGWKIYRINDDGTYTVALEDGTHHDGRRGRLLKTVDEKTLAAWQQIENHNNEIQAVSEALASKLEQSSTPEADNNTNDNDTSDNENESDAEPLSLSERLAARNEYRKYKRELKKRAKNVKKIRNTQKKQLRREAVEAAAQDKRTKEVMDYNNEQLEGRVKKGLIGSILRRLKGIRRNTETKSETAAETTPDNVVSLDKHRNSREETITDSYKAALKRVAEGINKLGGNITEDDMNRALNIASRKIDKGKEEAA